MGCWSWFSLVLCPNRTQSCSLAEVVDFRMANNCCSLGSGIDSLRFDGGKARDLFETRRCCVVALFCRCQEIGWPLFSYRRVFWCMLRSDNGRTLGEFGGDRSFLEASRGAGVHPLWQLVG